MRSRATTNALSIGYRAGEDRWWLWWPCSECGGARLPLSFRPQPQRGLDDVHALAARLAAERSCPGCETRRRRAGRGPGAPAVWFDTLAGDWLVRLPDGLGSEAILPLEIGCFDAAEVLVYRAASDIAHAGELLDR